MGNLYFQEKEHEKKEQKAKAEKEKAAKLAKDQNKSQASLRNGKANGSPVMGTGLRNGTVKNADDKNKRKQSVDDGVSCIHVHVYTEL